MEKVLKFNYPEDREMFELHDDGPEAIWLLSELLQKIRHDSKHGFIYEQYGEKADEYANNLRDWIIEEIGERQIRNIY